MPSDPNTPKNEKWKNFTRTLIHVLYFILALTLLVVALVSLDNFTTSIIFVYGTFIAIYLIIIEILYFCRPKKPCKAPDFVKRYLGFLTSAVGRGIFYQLLGLLYLMKGVWFIGLCLTALAVSAKAYHFTDWIEDEENEGELRLESDDEGDMNIGVHVLPDQLAVLV